MLTIHATQVCTLIHTGDLAIFWAAIVDRKMKRWNILVSDHWSCGLCTAPFLFTSARRCREHYTATVCLLKSLLIAERPCGKIANTFTGPEKSLS